MNCSETPALLTDLLYEQAAAEERSRLMAHLEGCDKCAERWRHLRALSAAADRWTAPPPPRGIAERALARVSSERTREMKRKWPDVLSVRLLGCVLLGAGAAAMSLLLAAGVVERQVEPLTVGMIGIVWTILYAGLFLTASHLGLRTVAWSALTSAGIALVLAAPLSIPTVVEACARWVRAAQSSAPLALVLLVVAAGYTAAPLLIGAMTTTWRQPHLGTLEGFKLSLLYGLLIAPAVYLQCVALPLEITAVWMAGALLGIAVGGPVGLRMGGWLRQLAGT